jgi:predicted dehydrogenase
VVLATGTSKRCFASMRELYRVLDGGGLGDVIHVEGNFSNDHSTRVTGGWRDDPHESPGYGMTGAGLHILDAFVRICGRVRLVDARGHSLKPTPNPRDVIAVLAQFESGATGLMASVRASLPFWRLHVFGTKGTAEARGEDTLIVSYLGGGKPETTTYEHVDSLKALMEAFIDAIEGRAPFLISPEQMLDMISVFEASIKSFEQKRPVEV